jgi:hypothetical protein
MRIVKYGVSINFNHKRVDIVLAILSALSYLWLIFYVYILVSYNSVYLHFPGDGDLLLKLVQRGSCLLMICDLCAYVGVCK